MSVEVRFLGTGSFSSPEGRFHSCVLIRDGTTTLLMDFGSTALAALTRDADPNAVDAVLVSHLHGDHFGGIPYLLMLQKFAPRSRPLILAGPPGLERRVRALATDLYADFYDEPLPYEVSFVALGSAETRIAGAHVSALPVVHVPSSEPLGLRVRIGGRLIAYSGDAEWSAAIPELARGADLFICEATTYALRWAGHLSGLEIAAHRDELGSARVVLTHLSGEALAHREEMPYEVAADGLTIRL